MPPADCSQWSVSHNVPVCTLQYQWPPSLWGQTPYWTKLIVAGFSAALTIWGRYLWRGAFVRWWGLSCIWQPLIGVQPPPPTNYNQNRLLTKSAVPWKVKLSSPAETHCRKTPMAHLLSTFRKASTLHSVSLAVRRVFQPGLSTRLSQGHRENWVTQILLSAQTSILEYSCGWNQCLSSPLPRAGLWIFIVMSFSALHLHYGKLLTLIDFG